MYFKKKCIIKVLLVFMLGFMIFNNFSPNSVYGKAIIENKEVESANLNVDYYEPGALQKEGSEKFTSIVGIVLGVVRNIAAVASVLILMVMGIKYMVGSITEKAEYKKAMIPYLLGFVLCFSGTVIITFIYNSLK